jgi:hypothetical protein
MSEPSEPRLNQKKNSFWDMFRFIKNGKPQSTVILMTFSYSLLFLAVYAIAYFFLIDLVEHLLGGNPVWLANLLESLVPAIAGAAVCALPMTFAKEKQYIPMGYVWLILYALAALIGMLVLLRDDADARDLFLRLFAMTVPAPLLLGGGLAVGLYRRWRKRNPPLEF